MIESVFSRLLLDLQNQIAAVCPDIKMVDRYLGQDQTDMKPALAYPAALVDIDTTDYSDMGELSQYADCTLSIRLFTDNYSSGMQKAPQKAREMQMRDFELEKRIVDAIHGWAPEDGYTEPLVRVSARTDNRNDIGLRVRTLTFRTAFEDVDLPTRMRNL